MYYTYNSQQYPTYIQQNYYTPDRYSRQGLNNQQQQFASTYSNDRLPPNKSLREINSQVDPFPQQFHSITYMDQSNNERKSESIQKGPLYTKTYQQDVNLSKESPKLEKSQVQPLGRASHYSKNQSQRPTLIGQDPNKVIVQNPNPMRLSYVQMNSSSSPLKHQKYETQAKNQFLFSPAPQLKNPPLSGDKKEIYHVPDTIKEQTQYQSPPHLDLNGQSPTKVHTRSISSKIIKPVVDLRQSQYQSSTQQSVTEPVKTPKLTYVSKTRPGENQRIPKTNQDSHWIQPNFCGKSSAYLFMVLDGHGQNGHFVSDWVYKQLLTQFENHFSLFINQHFDDSVISKAFHTCFSQVDSQLSQTGLDVSLSGSTIVVVVIIDNKMWCGNLGDSRAILISLKQSQLLIYELSHDHKPSNPLEMQRIRKAGGRVSPVRNQQGQGLGPMRVWAKNYQYPGLAMSRSIGDALAHQVGVSTTPEIIGHTITPQDKYLVIGSDGLFEWITNQQVAKIILDCFEIGQTAQQTVDFLVQKATQEWNKLGDSVDDITCLLISLP